VDAARAAEFLAMSRKTLLALARKGHVPGHPVGQGVRKVWRFRLSELDSWMKSSATPSAYRHDRPSQKPYSNAPEAAENRAKLGSAVRAR